MHSSSRLPRCMSESPLSDTANTTSSASLLALHVVQALHPQKLRIQHLILIVPLVDTELETLSFGANIDRPFISGPELRTRLHTLLPTDQRQNINILNKPDAWIKRLPRTDIVLAEHDPMFNSQKAFVVRLTEARLLASHKDVPELQGHLMDTQGGRTIRAFTDDSVGAIARDLGKGRSSSLAV